MKRVAVVLAMVLTSSLAGADDLLQVYALSRQQDPQLASAKATRDATYENEPIARSLLLPNVGASGDFTWQHEKTTSSFSGNLNDRYTSYDTQITATQPLFRRDRLYQFEQAKTVVKQADANYASAEQDLIIRVAQAYFGVLGAQDTLQFARSEQKAIARQLDQAKQRFEVGLIAITGVHEAQARFDQSRADVISAENALDDAWEVLREIVGPLGPSELAALRHDLTIKDIRVASDIEAWSENALKNNPEVIAARLSAEAARQNIEIERSGHYPTLDLQGAYTTSESESKRRTDSDQWLAWLQLEVPIYTGGGVSASTRQARSNFQAAQEDYDRAKRATDRQVREAFRGVQSDLSRVKALQATTVSATSALEATTAGFEVGTRTLVDVLNSQRDLFAAKRDLSLARYDYILNLLSLEQAAGTLDIEDLKTVNAWLKHPSSLKKAG